MQQKQEMSSLNLNFNIQHPAHRQVQEGRAVTQRGTLDTKQFHMGGEPLALAWIVCKVRLVCVLQYCISTEQTQTVQEYLMVSVF